MKQRLTNGLSAVLQFFLVPVLILAAPAMWLYRRIGSSRMPIATQVLKKIGVFPIINHYYEPMFDDRQLLRPLEEARRLPGVDLNEHSQLQFLESLCYAPEILELKWAERGGSLTDFRLNNGSFESGDAEFLYQFLRAVKPKKVVEIGSGFSTKITHAALARNRQDSDVQSEHVCIEPYEQPWLERFGGLTLIRDRVETLDIDWSVALRDGDLLFIDSSHIIRPQGDVLKEYLEIIPQLSPGVYVHVHDVFTPRDYLSDWVLGGVKFWNEQYLMEMLLSNSSRYEVVAAVNFLKVNYFARLSKVCPYLERRREPGSFYFRVKPAMTRLL